jgi:uncharacterized protein (DUF1810 family)
MGYKKIQPRWKKGESGNKKGRPRKLVTQTILQLQELGINEVTAQEVKTVYMSLINATIKELEALGKDKTQPAIVRIVISQILSKKGYDIIEKMLDRSIGKAQMNIDHTTLGEKISEVNINIIDGTNGYQHTETLQETNN